MQIQEFQIEDQEAILNMFELNTPEFFSIDEKKDLAEYLNSERELYYVCREKDQIVGCGGINFSKDKKEAIISWDIFHPDYQGNGFGSQLLQFRLEKIHTFNEIKRIIVRTSQVVYPFYEKNGFELLEKHKDFWAPGFDMYLMQHKKQ